MGESVLLREEPEERLYKLEYSSSYVIAALIETTCLKEQGFLMCCFTIPGLSFTVKLIVF